MKCTVCHACAYNMNDVHMFFIERYAIDNLFLGFKFTIGDDLFSKMKLHNEFHFSFFICQKMRFHNCGQVQIDLTKFMLQIRMKP